MISHFLQVVILPSLMRSSLHSSDILLRTLLVSLWPRACAVNWAAALSFPLAALGIHIAALNQSTLFGDADVAATVEAAEASLWTVWAGEDKMKAYLWHGYSFLLLHQTDLACPKWRQIDGE